MRQVQGIVSVFAVACGVLVAAAALAQSGPVMPAAQQVPALEGVSAEAPEAYGISATTVVKIHASAFRPECSATTLNAYWDSGITYIASNLCMLYAPVQLPAGAVVTQVGFDGHDDDASLNINWGIYWVSTDSTDTTGFIAWYYSAQSSGSFSATAALSTPAAVDANRYYFALVELNKVGQDMALKGMRVAYKLQISPAPATATFSDVPTDYWAFRHIEALAASGITAGCGGGRFCPEGTIKRSEMAVFFAKALGLHWPN